MPVAADTVPPTRPAFPRSRPSWPLAARDPRGIPTAVRPRAGAVLIAAFAFSVGTAGAAELMANAHASIRSAEASRHVSTLADDAFEGREGGSRGGRAAGAYIVAQLETMGLEPAGDNGSYYQNFNGMRNILALLRGSDPLLSEQIVIVGAHYDHVGYGNAANSYGPFGFVHNGADDNASGVAGVLELAESLKHLPARPRRSILIAFWDGEEKGLLGSRHFLRVRPAPIIPFRPVFAVNFDMIGRLRGQRVTVYGTRTSVGLRSAVVRANNDPAVRSGLEVAFDWDIEEDSDHYAFITAGIPTVMFHTGLHDQYHRPSDDVQLVNIDGIEPVMRLALGFVAAIADDPGQLPAFRPLSRSESEATRRGLEAVAAPAASGGRGRWGIGTRADPCEPNAPIVVRVAPDSPAAAGGMLPGDRIITLDGVEPRSQDDMLARLRAAVGGVVLNVDRHGRIIEIRMMSPGSGQP